MIIALWAALAMLCQDVIGILLVQAEARNRAHLAALLDVLYWPAGMVCTSISVTAWQSHSPGRLSEVVALVEAANVVGSYVAVMIGKRWIRNDLAVRVAAVERKLAELREAP